MYCYKSSCTIKVDQLVIGSVMSKMQSKQEKRCVASTLPWYGLSCCPSSASRVADLLSALITTLFRGFQIWQTQLESWCIHNSVYQRSVLKLVQCRYWRQNSKHTVSSKNGGNSRGAYRTGYPCAWRDSHWHSQKGRFENSILWSTRRSEKQKRFWIIWSPYIWDIKKKCKWRTSHCCTGVHTGANKILVLWPSVKNSGTYEIDKYFRQEGIFDVHNANHVGTFKNLPTSQWARLLHQSHYRQRVVIMANDLCTTQWKCNTTGHTWPMTCTRLLEIIAN